MEPTSKTKTSEILSDSPITAESQDCLRRVPFVEALYQEITKLPFEDSFCFGLYGSWGEGKTSILNLLKNKLKENQETILFEFDPWYFASKELILKHFLEGLGRTLRPSVPKKLRKFFEKNFRKFSLGVTVLGTGGQIAFEFEEKDLLKLKDEINAQIVKTEKKLVILIDDIDRLQLDEILLVFKLVKLIADFKHTVFLLSFDAEATKSVLQKQNKDIGYIDKIVQKPIPLPKVEQNDINQFLYSAFDELFEKLNLDNQRIKEELKEFSLVYQQHARKLFITLRGIKRYVNSLLSSLPPVVNEVHLFDFLILEIIKVFAPGIYTDIYENWQFYVPQRTSNESEIWLNPLKLKKGQEKETIVKEHIEQLLQSEPQKEVFTNLLDSLFPRFSSEEDARRKKRIYSTSFLKYFTLRVPSRELSDESIEREISSWNSNRLSSNELWEKAPSIQTRWEIIGVTR